MEASLITFNAAGLLACWILYFAVVTLLKHLCKLHNLKENQ